MLSYVWSEDIKYSFTEVKYYLKLKKHCELLKIPEK